MTNNARSLAAACAAAFASVILMSSPAGAQPACPPATDTQYTGTLGEGQSTGSITIDLQPCETVHIELQASVGGTHPSRDAHMTLRIRNNANEDLSVNTFGCVASCAETVPRNPNSEEGYPLPGTRGDEGLAETFSLRVNFLGWWAGGPVTYTMWVHRRPRSGYNIGGTTFMNAPLVGRNETLYASLSDKEFLTGQYYKFILHPGEAVHLGGLVTANSTYGATFRGYLYDENYYYLETLADFGTWGTTVFPQTTNPTTYTNTSGIDKTYYLRIRPINWSLWDIQIQLRVPAALQLSLFLDGDGLDPNDVFGTDDAARFVPGRSFDPLQQGASVELPQQATLVAAYVNQNGQIVPPPPGVTQATITLTETTGYPGYAMNKSYGDSRDTQLDYGLVDQAAREQTATVSFSSNQARVTLWVHDYGGVAKARALAGEIQTGLLGLPAAVPGWGDGDTSAGNDNHGDGFNDFEEWRGFMFQGVHIRTDPNVKDLFVYFLSPELAAYGAGYAHSLGINIRRVFQSEVEPGDSYINFNSDHIEGHQDQRALRILENGFSFSSAGAWIGTSLNAPRTVNTTDRIEIFSQTIRNISPSHNDETTPDPVYDDPKTRQTIAHEIGHAVTLNHIEVGYACPASPFTVMLGEYFMPSPGNGPLQNAPPGVTTMCAWERIPQEYTSSELSAFKVR